MPLVDRQAVADAQGTAATRQDLDRACIEEADRRHAALAEKASSRRWGRSWSHPARHRESGEVVHEIGAGTNKAAGPVELRAPVVSLESAESWRARPGNV